MNDEIESQTGCESDSQIICAPDASAHRNGGRRIYIHESSLADLAHESVRAATLVYSMLARMTLVKIVNHRISDAALLGILPAADVATVSEVLREGWSRDVTEAMHQVLVRRRGSETRRWQTESILRPDESIAATCYFSNYYTFATDDESAREMFADTNEIATIRRLKEEQLAYHDLELIGGRSLSLLGEKHGRQPRLMPAEIDRIRIECQSVIRAEFEALVEHQTSAANRDTFRELSSRMEDAFSRGILRPET